MQFASHIYRNADGTQTARPLEDHLRSVASVAADFATAFMAQDWAQAAGLWHDLGKYQTAWQHYLRSHFTDDPHDAEPKGSVPHALAGAQYAERELPNGEGRLLAYIIAGHHAGLPDFLENGGLKPRLQEAQIQDKRNELKAAFLNKAHIPKNILAKPALQPDVVRMGSGTGQELALSLWLRMLFSCLVDADFLDAEAFLNPAQHAQRPKPLEAVALLPAFNAYMADKATNAQPSNVNSVRAEVLAACRAAGAAPHFESGLYSLTVPTGGGKTLASLAFALEHARTHGNRRVIYAIPFTSIIEQTAQIFRDIFHTAHDQEGVVLEHHSNLDPDPKKQPPNMHLATENWDAPLIVTTNVQLFESLFAAKTTRCRKLHNLVNSVIVLDEAQQLPLAYLAPITQVLKLLAQHYGVTVLLCTATQPNLQGQADAFGRSAFPGIGPVREVMADPATLHTRLKRVAVTIDNIQTLSWDALAAELLGHDCALTIVNTRQDARDLYAALGEDSGRVHLSARMCPEHRSQVIGQIKRRLNDKREGRDMELLRVVSTTLVEAGVDLDFPVVYRSLAGLDSIAQAAGRCNREGLLQGLGQVVVFRPEKERGKDLMQDARNVASELIASGKVRDALAPQTFADYFALFYARAGQNKGGLDAKGIVNLLKPDAKDCAMSFRTAAEAFKLIDEEGQQSVVVRYARDGAMLEGFNATLGALAKDPTQKWAYRKLQRFSVSVPQHEFAAMEKMQMLETVAGLFVVRAGWYDRAFGLREPDEGMTPAELCLT